MPTAALSERRTGARKSRLGLLDGDAPSAREPRRPVASPPDLESQIAELSTMAHAKLRSEWRRLYRVDAPKLIRRDVLELGVAFRLQERVLGGLGASAKRRLTELTRTMEAKGNLTEARAIRPRPGARLMRQWGGITHDVTVLQDGFSWQGEQWRSLSAIAQAITGTHWSGPRFFGLHSKAKNIVAENADA